MIPRRILRPRAVLQLCWSRSSSTSYTPSTFKLPPTISQLLSTGRANDGPATPSEPTSTEVCGWIKSIRKQKNVSFAVLTDGSSDTGLQAVILKKKDGDEEHESLLRRLTNGAAVRLRGKLVESPGAGQAFELLVDGKDDGSIVVLGECDPETYPIQKKALTNEYLREHTHLRARTSHIAAMLRLRNTLQQRIGTFFSDQGFISANTPILTANDAEGAGESFRIAPMQLVHPAASPDPASSPPPSSSPQEKEALQEFFARPAYMTVSHQLHLEALTTALSRVYTLSPCFRAEPSLTRRHLAEFWMLEAEWVFSGASGVGSLCDFVEALLKSVVSPLLDAQCADPDVQALWRSGDAEKLASLRTSFASTSQWWVRMTYTEAVEKLQKADDERGRAGKPKFEYPVKWGSGLQSEHEKYLAEEIVGGPVFVTDYPRSLKPFYMRLNPPAPGDSVFDKEVVRDGNRATVACFDLLVPHIGELVGGSVREERLDILKRNMEDVGMTGEGDEWYKETRKWGGAPHGGFGMGFERLVSWVGGVDNVRECVAVPRWAGRMEL